MSSTSCGNIVVEPPFESSDVAITDCGVSSTSAVADGSVGTTATATVSNNNNTTASVSVDFIVGGSTLDTITNDVPGGSSADFELDIVFEEAGEVDVGVDLASVSEA